MLARTVARIERCIMNVPSCAGWWYVLVPLMDARTFVNNYDGIKTGYTKDVR